MAKKPSIYFDRETHKFVGLDDSMMSQLKETFRPLDVDAELRKMVIWLQTAKGNRRSGNMSFIYNWLCRTQTSHTVESLEELDTTLRPYLNKYLEEVWKRAENVLAFNQIRKKS